MFAQYTFRLLGYFFTAIVLALSLVLLMNQSLTTVQAAGTTYVVNSTVDEPDADPSNGTCLSTPSGKCTLRAAIMQANHTTGVNTITVPAGVYVLTRYGYDDDALAGDLDIVDDLTIQGAGAGVTIVDGNGAVIGDRVFHVLDTAQNVSLSGMTIRNGSVCR